VVLAAFQVADWSERILDPLEWEPGLDPTERLRETVKSLNRGLTPGTIRFHADGTGAGIRWEPVAEEKIHLPGITPRHDGESP
jgi:hypothetical protein